MYAPGDNGSFADAMAAGQFASFGYTAVILVNESHASLFDFSTLNSPITERLRDIFGKYRTVVIGSAGKGSIYETILNGFERRYR